MTLFEDGDPFFAPMLNALFAAFRGTAVMSGCEVSATGTSRTVSITAGSVQINGEVIAVSAGSATLDAGSTFDRYDLVSVNASGSKIVTKGTTKRKCPTQPANTCLLAIVFVPAGATVVTSGNVYDARMDAMRLSVLNIIATNYCLAHTFVDVPGTTLRKQLDLNVSTSAGYTWVRVASVTVPDNYHPTVYSNCRVSVSATFAATHDSPIPIQFRAVVDGRVIGTGNISLWRGQAKTCTFDTTGGFVAGDRIAIEMQIDDSDPQGTATATGLTLRSSRATNQPVPATYVEAGTW